MTVILVECIGYIAGVFTTFAGIPQLIQCVKTKSTKDLSYYTMGMIETGCTLWTVYGICINNIPLIIYDIIPIILYTTLCILKWKYEHIQNPEITVEKIELLENKKIDL
jgi:MtN3 and saliva related transmembrane protein